MNQIEAPKNQKRAPPTRRCATAPRENFPRATPPLTKAQKEKGGWGHITRLIVAIGLRPLAANVRAVLAVLVRSDDKNDSPSDRFVYSLMQVKQSSFFKWKAAINTLRSNGG